MPKITQVGRVLVPVADQDEAITFYTKHLGFSLVADHAELQTNGVDVDAEMMGGDDKVPLLFFFRDNNNNQLMIVQSA